MLIDSPQKKNERKGKAKHREGGIGNKQQGILAKPYIFQIFTTAVNGKR